MSKSICVITKNSYEHKDVAETYIGPVWIGFWQGEKYVFSNEDMILLPRHFKPWLDALCITTKDWFFVPENCSFYVR